MVVEAVPRVIRRLHLFSSWEFSAPCSWLWCTFFDAFGVWCAACTFGGIAGALDGVMGFLPLDFKEGKSLAPGWSGCFCADEDKSMRDILMLRAT